MNLTSSQEEYLKTIYILSKTEKEMQVAQRQLKGRLSNKIEDIRKDILNIMADIEASIDYPEYDIEETTNEKIKKFLNELEEKLNSLEKTYKSEAGKLITNIKYQDKNKLVCMYTDSVSIIENETENELVNSNDKKITFQSIDLENSVCYVEEKSSGLFTADSIVNIVNADTKETKQYLVNYVAKEIYTNGNIIALNLGTEIEFINTGGWLVKRYVANQEITSVVVSDSIAGIIYRDKIEIINL